MMAKHDLAFRGAGAALLLGIFSTPAAAQSGHGSPSIPSDAIRLPCCRCLDGTSQTFNIDTGTGAWRVTTPTSSSFQPAVPIAADPAWTPVAPAGWVGPAGNDKDPGRYLYRLRFWYPPTCLVPARVTVTGQFAADNSARVNVDGQFVIASQGPIDHGFLPASITPFSYALAPGGLHALTVTVNNLSNVTGLILQGTIWVTCPAQGADGTVSWLSRPPPPRGTVDRRQPPRR